LFRGFYYFFDYLINYLGFDGIFGGGFGIFIGEYVFLKPYSYFLSELLLSTSCYESSLFQPLVDLIILCFCSEGKRFPIYF